MLNRKERHKVLKEFRHVCTIVIFPMQVDNTLNLLNTLFSSDGSSFWISFVEEMQFN